MGGYGSMVSAGTTDVFFEAAFFHPDAIQGKARELGLTSDAAYRFERGVDFGATRSALERATALTLEICGGKPGPISEAKGELPRRDAVRVRPDRVRRLLGYPVADGEMRDVLTRLACAIDREGPVLEATPPTWRFDLAIEEDFVEEIARIHGYDHVPSEPPHSSLPMVRLPEGERSRFDLRHLLAALGYQEVVNYSFVAEEWERDFAANESPVRLANPIASHMSVIEGSEASLDVQPERVAGLAFGSAWPEQWAQKGAPVDFFDAKGDVESLAAPRPFTFTRAAHPACHPGRSAAVFFQGKPVGFVGELHPRLQQKYELPSAPVVFELLAKPLLEGQFPRFGGISRMPAVRRDLAFLVSDETAVGSLLEAVRERVPAFVREVEVFDQYRGKGVESGKKSLALRIVMQDTDRTLTDSEVEGVVASIREQLNEQFQAKPRT
jgi:phenylalanyl-tRNA synthetase beta chain